MKMSITRKLHQLTSNTDVIERNRRNRDTDYRQQICITSYSPIDCEELVFLQPKDFELIFGKKDGDRKDKGLPIVKITNPHNGRHVYRAFRTSSEIQGFKDYAGITYTAIKQISEKRDELQTLDLVLLSKGYRIPFYWSHPNHATRIAIQMGTISILLGVVSVIPSIVKPAIQWLMNLM